MTFTEMVELVRTVFPDAERRLTGPAALDSTPFPAQTVEFLRTVGTPLSDIREIDFTPALAPTRDDLGVYSPDAAGTSGVVIASTPGSVFVVAVERSCQVVCFEESDPGEYFVNSSLPQFVAALALYCEPAVAGRIMDDQDRAKEFSDRLSALDAAAITAPRSWWAITLEEIGYGLA